MTTPIDVSAAPVRRPSDYGQPGMQGTAFQPGMDRQNPPSGGGTHLGGLHLEVSIVGPVFDGMAQAAMASMIDEMQYHVAAQGLANVQMLLDRSIQHPTPYYETQVTVQRLADDWVVHDRGIVYGPWLEGTSRRNATTRFRGYHSFRRATEQLRGRIPQLIAPILNRWLGRIS
jgi:hypothetical protein